MPGKLIKEITVPAEYGRAWRLDKGQTMRIIAIDGPQVGDLAVFNAHNYREIYDPTYSYVVNSRQGTGSATKIQYLYSRPSRMNLMLEITEDKVERHQCLSGSRCNPRIYELRGVTRPVRSCQGNLAEAIAEFGIPPMAVSTCSLPRQKRAITPTSWPTWTVWWPFRPVRPTSPTPPGSSTSTAAATKPSKSRYTSRWPVNWPSTTAWWHTFDGPWPSSSSCYS